MNLHNYLLEVHYEQDRHVARHLSVLISVQSGEMKHVCKEELL